MPLVFIKNDPEFILGIWESNETFDELASALPAGMHDPSAWKSLSSEKRKREWLTVRVLIAALSEENQPVPELSYTEPGKPMLSNGHRISISHTRTYVAVIISPKREVGIDLETFRERIEVLAPKFAGQEEFLNAPASRRMEYFHVIWGAKEVMFKISGQTEVDFKAHMRVKPFGYLQSGQLCGSIQKNSFRKEYRIYYEWWNNMMLAYCAAEEDK